MKKNKNLETLRPGPAPLARTTPPINALETLEQGATHVVNSRSWKRDKDFILAVHNAYRRSEKKFSVKTLADRSGWLVTRLS